MDQIGILSKKKQLIRLAVILFVVIAIPLTMYLIRQQQILRSRAHETGTSHIDFLNLAGEEITTGQTSVQNVKLRLAYAASAVSPSPTPGATATPRPTATPTPGPQVTPRLTADYVTFLNINTTIVRWSDLDANRYYQENFSRTLYSWYIVAVQYNANNQIIGYPQSYNLRSSLCEGQSNGTSAAERAGTCAAFVNLPAGAYRFALVNPLGSPGVVASDQINIAAPASPTPSPTPTPLPIYTPEPTPTPDCIPSGGSCNIYNYSTCCSGGCETDESVYGYCS